MTYNHADETLGAEQALRGVARADDESILAEIELSSSNFELIGAVAYPIVLA